MWAELRVSCDFGIVIDKELRRNEDDFTSLCGLTWKDVLI